MPEKVLDTHVLETFKSNKSHTADNIVKELKRVVNNWGIAEKVVCAVTDNASNMVAAIAKAGWQHVQCFTHTLNLHTLNFIVKDSSDQPSAIQHKCKEIVSYFHCSVNSFDKLREVQQQQSLPEVKLIQEMPTHWNYTYLQYCSNHLTHAHAGILSAELRHRFLSI